MAAKGLSIADRAVLEEIGGAATTLGGTVWRISCPAAAAASQPAAP